jgi:hypothetical protein
MTIRLLIVILVDLAAVVLMIQSGPALGQDEADPSVAAEADVERPRDADPEAPVDQMQAPAPTATPQPTATPVACPPPGMRTAPAGTQTPAGAAPSTIAVGFAPGQTVELTLIGPGGRTLATASQAADASCSVGALPVPSGSADGVYAIRWRGMNPDGQPVALTDRFLVGPGTGRAASGSPSGPSAPRVPATCTDPPTMEIHYGPRGAIVEAQGFRPGSVVYAWLIRIGGSIAKPSRLPDLTWTADEDCRIAEGFTVTAAGLADRALFLAGPRYGGGAEITMWRKVDLQIRQ